MLSRLRSLPWAQAFSLTMIGLLVGSLSALTFFLNSTARTTVGPFEAEVKPMLTPWAVVDFGALLPQMRYPLNNTAGLGLQINMQGTTAGSFAETVSMLGVMGSNPDGEIAHLKEEVVELALQGSLFGVFTGLLAAMAVAAIWKIVGRRRRASLVAKLRQKDAWPRLLIPSLAIVLLLPPLYMIQQQTAARTGAARSWLPLQEAFPQAAHEELKGILLEDTPMVDEVQELVAGALATYDESTAFYQELALKASELELRQPKKNETVALVVTDRHNNVGMDKVARALGDKAGATVLLNLGDDTSAGADWEAFSIHSLKSTFKDYEKAAIAGNHDSGKMVKRELSEAGFKVLAGRVEEVGGLRVLGQSDPRSSAWGKGYKEDAEQATSAVQAKEAELIRAACVTAATGQPVSLVMVHSPAMGKALAATGCAPLILSGHMHRQIGPKAVAGERGTTVTLTTGSTGGAAYAWAMGSKLRRDAQATLVTFNEKGEAKGLQIITFTTGKTLEASDFYELRPNSRQVPASLSLSSERPSK